MIPTPYADRPEQYSVSSYTDDGNRRYRVSPEAPGSQLDMWDFEVRDEDTVVLVKHIGGKKYQANHSMPEAVPLVVAEALRGRIDHDIFDPVVLVVANDSGVGPEKCASLPVDKTAGVVHASGTFQDWPPEAARERLRAIGRGEYEVRE